MVLFLFISVAVTPFYWLKTFSVFAQTKFSHLKMSGCHNNKSLACFNKANDTSCKITKEVTYSSNTFPCIRTMGVCTYNGWISTKPNTVNTWQSNQQQTSFANILKHLWTRFYSYKFKVLIYQ